MKNLDLPKIEMDQLRITIKKYIVLKIMRIKSFDISSFCSNFLADS